MHKMYTSDENEEKTFIDPDGSGPLKPFQALCSGKGKQIIITYWHGEMVILHDVSNTSIHLLLIIMMMMIMLVKTLIINRYIVYVALKVLSNDIALF